VLHLVVGLPAVGKTTLARQIEAETRRAPGSTYELSDNDHDRFAAAFVAPSELELASATRPAPPPGFATWSDWASWRWPSLPASC
jgi:hypothetical protein